MSKQTLITSPTPAFELDTPKIQLDAKIRTDDLLDAVIFEKEDELEKLSETTDKEYQKQEKIRTAIYTELKKLTENFRKKYKSKKAHALVKALHEFGQDKLEISIDIRLPKLKDITIYFNGNDEDDEDDEDDDITNKNNKLQINITLGNRHQYFERIEYIDIPSNIMNKINAYNNETKTLTDLTKIKHEIGKQKSKLTHIKKRIKASFIKTLIKGGVKDNAELLNSLRDELDLQIKK